MANNLMDDNSKAMDLAHILDGVQPFRAQERTLNPALETS